MPSTETYLCTRGVVASVSSGRVILRKTIAFWSVPARTTNLFTIYRITCVTCKSVISLITVHGTLSLGIPVLKTNLLSIFVTIISPFRIILFYAINSAAASIPTMKANLVTRVCITGVMSIRIVIVGFTVGQAVSSKPMGSTHLVSRGEVTSVMAGAIVVWHTVSSAARTIVIPVAFHVIPMRGDFNIIH